MLKFFRRKPVAQEIKIIEPVKEEINWLDPNVRYAKIDEAYEHNRRWRRQILELINTPIEGMLPLPGEMRAQGGKEQEPRI